MEDTGLNRTALVLEAGRAIRPYLVALIGDQASRIDDQLGEILNRPDSSTADIAVLDVLDELQPTHDWVSGFYRARGVPPEVVKAMQPGVESAEAEHRVRIAILGGGASAGDPVLMIPGLRYICPLGDWVWYRLDAAEQVPVSPCHGLPLERAELPMAKG
jgi:hypothetical protein